MERSKQAPLFIWALLAGLLSQNLVIPVISTSFEDQKNYYSPDPHAGSPPTGSHGSPPYGTSPPSYGTPSHGSGGSYGSTPPSHGTPSHGSGGSYGSRPPSHGSGGSCTCTPTPSHGSGGTTHDPTPSTPSGGGGGYYHSPPTSTSSPPVIISPPTSGTPSVPTPPFAFDPNTPPFTCNYWRTHPTAIWGLLGWWGTLGSAFGGTSFPGFGANMSLQQALSNSRTDGIGALYREGTASLLNSMANSKFPYTTKQVRESFVAALSSNKAAAAQAQLFKLANEGRLKPRV